MIKGINRQMIEVNQTGSIYYEKAFLIVKPEFSSAQQQILEKEALRLLKKMDAPSAFKRRRVIAMRVAFALLSAVCGGVLMYVVLKFGML